MSDNIWVSYPVKMKLNLLLDNPGGVRADYLNVDPLAPQDDKDRVACDLANLNLVVDAGEVDELLALDILDYADLHHAEGLLDHWLSRLAHGGTITLSTIDLMEVTKSLHNRLITVEQANLLLHGEQKKSWQYRQSSYTLAQLADTLRGKGLRVQKKRINQFQAIVEAVRP